MALPDVSVEFNYLWVDAIGDDRLLLGCDVTLCVKAVIHWDRLCEGWLGCSTAFHKFMERNKWRLLSEEIQAVTPLYVYESSFSRRFSSKELEVMRRVVKRVMELVEKEQF